MRDLDIKQGRDMVVYGEGCMIGPYSVLAYNLEPRFYFEGEGARANRADWSKLKLGNNVSIGNHVYIAPGWDEKHPTIIGDNVAIEGFVIIKAGVKIGNNVTIGAFSLIGEFSEIKENCYIGARSTIGPHVILEPECKLICGACLEGTIESNKRRVYKTGWYKPRQEWAKYGEDTIINIKEK